MYFFLELSTLTYVIVTRLLIKRSTQVIRSGPLWNICRFISQTNPLLILATLISLGAHVLGLAQSMRLVMGVFLVSSIVGLVFAQVVGNHEEIICNLVDDYVAKMIRSFANKIASSFTSVESIYEKAIDKVSNCTRWTHNKIKSAKQYISELTQIQKLKYFVIFCVAILTQILFGFMVIWYKNGMPYKHYKILTSCYMGWLITIFEATDMKISKTKEVDADQLAVITTQQSLFGDATKMTKKQKNSVVVVVLAILAYLVNNDISKFDAFFSKWNAMKQAVDSSNVLYSWLFGQDEQSESETNETVCANYGVERTCLGNKWGNGLCSNCTEDAIKKAFLHKVKAEHITSDMMTRDPELFASRLLEQMYQDQVNGESSTVALIPKWFKDANRSAQKKVTDILRVHLDTFISGQFHIYSNGKDYAIGGMATIKFRSHKRPDATTQKILSAQQKGKTAVEIQDKYFESTHSESTTPRKSSTPRTTKQFNFKVESDDEGDDEKSSEEDIKPLPSVITEPQAMTGSEFMTGFKFNVGYKKHILELEKEILKIIVDINHKTSEEDIISLVDSQQVIILMQPHETYEEMIVQRRHTAVYYLCMLNEKIQRNKVVFENTMKSIGNIIDQWTALFAHRLEDYHDALVFYQMQLDVVVIKQPLWLTCVDLTDKFFVNLQKVILLPTKIPYIGVFFDSNKSGLMTSWLAYTILFSLMQALVKMLMREKIKEKQANDEDLFEEVLANEKIVPITDALITSEESKGGMSKHRQKASFKQRHVPEERTRDKVHNQEYYAEDLHLPVEKTHMTAFISYDPTNILKVIQQNPNVVKALAINNATVSGAKAGFTTIEEFQKIMSKTPDHYKDDVVVVPNTKYYRKGEWKTILKLYPEAFKWYVDTMDYELMQPMQKLAHHEDIPKYEMDKIKSAWQNKNIVISDPQSASLFKMELNRYVYDPKTSMNKYREPGGRTYELTTVQESSDIPQVLKRQSKDDIDLEADYRYVSSRPQDYENVKRSLGLTLYTKDLRDRTADYPQCRERLQDIEKQIASFNRDIDILDLQKKNKDFKGITNPESVDPTKPFQYHAPDIRAMFCIGYEDENKTLRYMSGCMWTGQSIYTTKHTFIKDDRNLLKELKFFLIHPFTRCKTSIQGIDVIKTGKYANYDICRPIISGFPALLERIKEKLSDDDYKAVLTIPKLTVINPSDQVLGMTVIKYSFDGNWNLKTSFGKILAVMNEGIVKTNYQSEKGDSGSEVFTEHGTIVGMHLGDIEKQRGFQSFDADLAGILRSNASLQWGQDFC